MNHNAKKAKLCGKTGLRLVVTLLICCLMMGVVGCQGQQAQTTSSNSSSSTPDEGPIVYADATFEKNYTYQTASPIQKNVVTIEAVLCVSKNTANDKRSGAIVGNFQEARNFGIADCFNVEVHQYGVPRLYAYSLKEGKEYDIRFGDVNLRTGEWTHLAIAIDHEAGTVSCYVNGELKQTVKAKFPSDLEFRNPLAIGSDLRSGNTEYFKGSLREVTLYTDLRTAEEIAADSKGTTQNANDPDCLGQYKLNADLRPLRDVNGKGPEFTAVSKVEENRVFVSDHEPMKGYDFAFVAVPDTQIINYQYPKYMPKIYDWIIDNVEEKKIKFVMGLGDITDQNTVGEWIRGATQISRLNGVVPYSFVRGNHDKIPEYDQYMSYDKFKGIIDGSYEQSMRNTYKKLTIGEINYLFLNLDFAATQEVLDWAGNVIQENSDHRVIISTHIYLDSDATTVDIGDGSPATKYGGVFTADKLWDKLVSKYENIQMVICGHKPTEYVVTRQRKGVNGNTVTEVLVDAQSADGKYAGLGMVAILYFSDNGKHVDIEYYSTIQETYFRAENQYGFDLTLKDVPEEIPQETPDFPWLVEGIAAAALIAAVATFLILRKKKKAEC